MYKKTDKGLNLVASVFLFVCFNAASRWLSFGSLLKYYASQLSLPFLILIFIILTLCINWKMSDIVFSLSCLQKSAFHCSTLHQKQQFYISILWMLGSCQHWEFLHSPHHFLFYLNHLVSFSVLFRVNVKEDCHFYCHKL